MSSEKMYFLLIYVFQPIEFKSDVHFRRPEPKTLDNPKKKTKIHGLSGVSGAG